MSTKRALGLVVCVLACSAGIGAVTSSGVTTPPLPFDHAGHFSRMFAASDGTPPSAEEITALVDNPRTCEVCHTSVLKRPQAGRPALWVCARCHAADVNAAAVPEPRRDLALALAKGDELKWPALYDVDGHVYFSHSRHLDYERPPSPPATLLFNHPVHLQQPNVTCEKCHVNPQTGVVAIPTDAACIDCHAEADREDPQMIAEGKCAKCHGAEAPQPVRARFANFPAIQFDHGKHLAAKIECVACHSGILDSGIITADSAPRMSACIDCHAARNQPTGCRSCHTEVPRASGRAQVACTECHGEIARSTALPSGSDNYTMERCLECHRDRAASTDCMSCHR